MTPNRPAVEETIKTLRNYWPSGSTEALLAVPKKAAEDMHNLLTAYEVEKARADEATRERDEAREALAVAVEALCQCQYNKDRAAAAERKPARDGNHA